jgi:hypothetical protein
MKFLTEDQEFDKVLLGQGYRPLRGAGGMAISGAKTCETGVKSARVAVRPPQISLKTLSFYLDAIPWFCFKFSSRSSPTQGDVHDAGFLTRQNSLDSSPVLCTCNLS